MSVVEPHPIPETVEVLLDTTWRVASAESWRTDGLDRRAATVATFTSVVAALTATLGVRLVEDEPRWWTLALFLMGLGSLVGAVGFSLLALRPKAYAGLGIDYVRRFPTLGEMLKPPEQVRGEAMRAIIAAVARERATNEGRVESIRTSFTLLFVGLVLVGAEGATLGIKDVIG